MTPSRLSSRGHDSTKSSARSNASASRDAAISCSARSRSCGVLVAVDRGDQERALELAALVEVQHRPRPAPAGRRDARAGQRGPLDLLAVVEVLDGDPPQLALEDLDPPVLVRRHRQHAALDAQAPAAAAAHRADDDRAAAVDLAVEQRVQRDDRVVVLRRRMDEVDDDAGLLARMPARDAADALLVDALRRGRREVHADRRARRVPALGEQLRVDEHVDVAALVAGEDLGQLALRRLARHRLRLQPDVAERLGDVVGVAHAGGVDDAGHAVEARLVEVGDREVERQLVEQLGQHLLVELGVDLAAAQRHLGDRAHAGPGRDADAAQRRDHAAPRGLREVEARRLRREEVGDVAGDQRARRGHADEHRLVPVADRRRRLLAERGVRLVADDDRVRVGDVAGVAHEPLVGLDRHRAVGAVLAAHERRRDALGVAAVAQLAEELVDEVAAVGEDQRAAGARALDEAERGDGLAGAGRVLEPEALGGVRVLGRLGELLLVVRVAAAASSSQSCGSSGSSSSSSSSSPGMPGRARAAPARPRARAPFGDRCRCPPRRAAR